MAKLIKKTYEELKIGDEFRIKKSNDKRVFRKERNGALQIVDSDGYPCEKRGFRGYCYLTMPVWIKR